MDFDKIHKRFKDKHSPSVTAQIKWLEKQGFQPNHIEKAMLLAYGEIESGRVPVCWERLGEESPKRPPKVYSTAGHPPPDQWYSKREIEGGKELCKFILATANRIQKKHHGVMKGLMESLDKERERQWARRLPWWKRLLGLRK